MSNDFSGSELMAKPRKRDPEFWIAIGALVMSAVAMIFSFLQLNLQRNQERALVWPHVSARPSYSDKGFAFIATNKGLGPALVRRVELQVDGKTVQDWNGVLENMLGPKHGYGWDKIKGNDVEDTILAATESATLFSVPWDERIRASFASGNRIRVRVCYCSFLDECWWSSSGLDHQSVATCPTPK
jgi:hypothetical protein